MKRVHSLLSRPRIMRCRAYAATRVSQSMASYLDRAGSAFKALREPQNLNTSKVMRDALPRRGRSDATYVTGAWAGLLRFQAKPIPIAGRKRVKTTAWSIGSDSIRCSRRTAKPVARLRSIPATISKGIRAKTRLLTRSGGNNDITGAIQRVFFWNGSGSNHQRGERLLQPFSRARKSCAETISWAGSSHPRRDHSGGHRSDLIARRIQVMLHSCSAEICTTSKNRISS